MSGARLWLILPAANLAFGLFALGLAGCSKASESSVGGEAGTTERAAASAITASVPSAAPSAADAPATWSGRYAASPGAVSIPDAAEWAGVKFRGDDAGVGRGDGTLTITVAPGGRVRGALEGPLGPLRVTGELTENGFAGALVSEEPGRGFSGTAIGTRTGDQVSGTMRLSLPTANVVREASFTLERKR